MLDKPPGWPLLTAFALAALVALWWASAPYVYVEFVIWVVFVGGALGAGCRSWLGAVPSRASAGRWGFIPSAGRRRRPVVGRYAYSGWDKW